MYILGGEFRPHFTPWIGHWKSKLKKPLQKLLSNCNYRLFGDNIQKIT